MATCWARAVPYINTCCYYISINCDQSHWQIYLLQSLFHITKSLLICIALFGNLPKYRKEKVGEIIIRYLNMLSSYWRTLGGCDNMTSVPAVSSSSHSSLFTPVILVTAGDSGSGAVVVGCDDGPCYQWRAPHTGRYCDHIPGSHINT